LSLAVAFEDPDGAKLKALLTNKYLFLFGNRVAVKKWKQHRKVIKDTTQDNAIEHPTNGDLLNKEEDVKITLRTPTEPVFPFASSPSPSTFTIFQGGNGNQPTAGNLFGQHPLERDKTPKPYSIERNSSRMPTECSKLPRYSLPRTRSANNPTSGAKGKNRA
jgi:hypothetical protein